MKSVKENILKRTRNTNIDLLKLCASIGVIGLHTFKYDAAPILYYLCCFSVPVFFMVSGYFLLNRATSTGGGGFHLKNSLHNTNSSFMEHNTLFDIFIRYSYWKKYIRIFDNILNNTNFKKPFTKGKNVAFLVFRCINLNISVSVFI